MTWPARAIFALLVAATFLAFFAAQRLKGAPPVAEVRGLADEFSPNGDGFKDRNRFRVRLQERRQVAVDVVDEGGDAVRRLTGDAVVEPGELRDEIIARLAAAADKDRHFSTRRHGVPPV